MSRASRQHVFAFRRRGGARLGAGRKPAGRTPGVPHRARPVHDRRRPVHVTVRAVRGLPSLRAHRIFRAIRGGLACSSSAHFHIVHFTVQTNHLHLLVEARRHARAVARDAGARHSPGEGDQPADRTRRPRVVRSFPLPRAANAPRGPERSDLRFAQWPEASRDRARDRSLLLGGVVRRVAPSDSSSSRGDAGAAADDLVASRRLAAQRADRNRRRTRRRGIGSGSALRRVLETEKLQPS